MPRLIDLSGQRFGRLTVISFSHKIRTKKTNRYWWKCICECGTECLIDRATLRKGTTKSCGCYRRDAAKARRYSDAPEAERRRDARRRWWAKNRQSHNAKRRSQYAADPVWQAARVAEWRRAKREQEGKSPKPAYCQVCGNGDSPIHFDHCHKTGRFRGWLCARCNFILGLARDSPKTLHGLAAYLEVNGCC